MQAPSLLPCSAGYEDEAEFEDALNGSFEEFLQVRPDAWLFVLFNGGGFNERLPQVHVSAL